MSPIRTQGKSKPPRPGRHRTSRLMVLATPFVTPSCRRASSAYREQLGSKTQRVPRRGETSVRYQRRTHTLARIDTGRDGKGRVSTSASACVWPKRFRITDGPSASSTRSSTSVASPSGKGATPSGVAFPGRGGGWSPRAKAHLLVRIAAEVTGRLSGTRMTVSGESANGEPATSADYRSLSRSARAH